MDYVLIKNGKVVVDGVALRKDVLIGNDKIVEILEKIDRPEPETPVINAEGKFVLPGAIDTNILFGELVQQDEMALNRFNQAQIIGGTTTVLEPVLPTVSHSYKVELKRKKQIDYGINVDYGFHLSINKWKLFKGVDVDFCYAHEGIASFYLRWPVDNNELSAIKELLAVAARDSTPVLVDVLKPGEFNDGTGIAEVDSDTIQRHLGHIKALIDLAIELNCIVCLMNICFKEELEIIRKYDKDALIYAELMFPFHIADSDRLLIGDSSIFSGFPLINGLNLLSPDEVWPCLKKTNFFIARPMIKLSGTGTIKESQVANRPDEYILLKNLLSVLYTCGVVPGKMSFEEFVDVIAYRPALFMGLHPKKGVIRVGSDADVVIWNPDYKRNLYCHLPGYEGNGAQQLPLKGRVDFVFSKGCMVYDGESISKNLVKGRYVYRSPS
ncbi:amidohydrolase family protein [Carboxylicivirga mesophila]|uniref:Amidohydrolase family protein n=1 Tax=Carboxylicivirga mesophila TaxID=1166478 RepID=A0ABS5KC77_9BACT|nr:amidohydrolase family protein [Carboxylicivirga mesophila]MBS2212437.1 amidohydrolase family protein [Carboxylicivirga mesophila]